MFSSLISQGLAISTVIGFSQKKSHRLFACGLFLDTVSDVQFIGSSKSFDTQASVDAAQDYVAPVKYLSCHIVVDHGRASLG
jgi:hypothetical protein